MELLRQLSQEKFTLSLFLHSFFPRINGYSPTLMSEISVGYDKLAFQDNSDYSTYTLPTREVFRFLLSEPPDTVHTTSVDSLCSVHKLGTVFQKTSTLPDFPKKIKTLKH